MKQNNCFSGNRIASGYVRKFVSVATLTSKCKVARNRFSANYKWRNVFNRKRLRGKACLTSTVFANIICSFFDLVS